jgi:hypothetical protein
MTELWPNRTQIWESKTERTQKFIQIWSVCTIPVRRNVDWYMQWFVYTTTTSSLEVGRCWDVVRKSTNGCNGKKVQTQNTRAALRRNLCTYVYAVFACVIQLSKVSPAAIVDERRIKVRRWEGGSEFWTNTYVLSEISIAPADVPKISQQCVDLNELHYSQWQQSDAKVLSH